MKTSTLLLATLLLGSPLFAADSTPKDELTAATQKLADKPNYSWKATTVVPESSPFKPGPTEGKTEKDGATYVTYSFGESLTEVVRKGDKAVITNQEGTWQTADEMEKEEGPGRFFAMLAKSLKAPAADALELIAAVKELKKDGDVYSGAMTEEGLKSQFRFGQPKNPKGSAKFWVKDGQLIKFEAKLQAKMEFNGNEMDVDRTTTTEIKEVGTTQVNVPEAAKKKLN